MKVTKVTMTIPKNANPNRLFKAWAKIVLDDALLINGIRLFEKRNNNGVVEKSFLFPEQTLPLHLTGGEKITIPIVNSNDSEFRNHILEVLSNEYDNHKFNPKNKKKEKDREDY